MFTVDVVSELFDAGTRCDGHPFIGERYFVQVENASGRRWQHVRTWAGVERVYDEETGDPHFVDLRPTATAAAERLAARVRAALETGARLDFAHWAEVDPAYGSDAYVGDGIEQQRAAAEVQEWRRAAFAF